MRLQFVTIGQNLNWPRGRLSLARKKKHGREFMTLALARVISALPEWNGYCLAPVIHENQRPPNCSQTTNLNAT